MRTQVQKHKGHQFDSAFSRRKCDDSRYLISLRLSTLHTNTRRRPSECYASGKALRQRIHVLLPAGPRPNPGQLAVLSRPTLPLRLAVLRSMLCGDPF